MKIFVVRRDLDAEFDSREVDAFLKKNPGYEISTACALDLCTLFIIVAERPVDQARPLKVFSR